MKYYIDRAKPVLALLTVAVTVAIGTGASPLAYAAPQTMAESPQLPGQATERANKKLPEAKKLPEVSQENRKKIRKENDRKLKSREPLYSQQAGSLADQYKETAEIVARQGGDPQPLLDAAAYFETQSE
ncbi:MAG: hypothetical protein H0X43_03590 [Nitrosospira sp.]|nr:hypothetical protein [Nitrosospira sp.]